MKRALIALAALAGACGPVRGPSPSYNPPVANYDDPDRTQCAYEARVASQNVRGGALYQWAETESIFNMCMQAKAAQRS